MSKNFTKLIRLGITLTAAVCVVGSVTVALITPYLNDGEPLDRSYDYGSMIADAVGIHLLISVPVISAFALYTWQVRGAVMSVLTGLLMLAATARLFVPVAVRMVTEGSCGCFPFGPPVLWAGIFAFAFNYVVVFIGIFVDALIQENHPRRHHTDDDHAPHHRNGHSPPAQP